MSYTYIPLPENHIRLLTIDVTPNTEIRCTIFAVDSSEHPEYTALSYTWGDPMPTSMRQPGEYTPKQSIILNDWPMPVSTNLYQALLQIHSTNLGPPGAGQAGPRPALWIDALCINQEDGHEKATQVAKMDDVYRNASRVLAWLGKADVYSAPAFYVMRQLAEITPEDTQRHCMYDLDHISSELHLPSVGWKCLTAVLSRAWFGRVWVIQEIVLGRKTVLLCGRDSMESAVLRKAFEYIAKSQLWLKLVPFAIKFTSAENQAGPREIPNLGMAVAALAGFSSGITEGVIDPGLVPIYGRGSGATDLRDHVYAMSGLIKMVVTQKQLINYRLPVIDYSMTVEAVFTAWARSTLQRNEDPASAQVGEWTGESENYGLFSLVEDKGHRRLGSLPSWVPDLTVSMMPFILRTRSSHRDWRPSGTWQDGRVDIVEDSNGKILRTPAAQLGVIADVATPFDTLANTSDYDWTPLLDFMQLPKHCDDASILAWANIMTAGDPLSTDAHFPRSTLLLDWILAKGAIPMTQNRDLLQEMSTRLFEQRRNTISVGNYQRSASLEEFDAASKTVRTTRRFFRTGNGSLGVAAESIKKDDEVWIFPSCYAPMIMRKHTDNGSYELMGEAYVHGAMHGEKAMDLLRSEIRIS